MRHCVCIGLVAGLGLLTALVAHYGAGTIVHAVATVGWRGFAIVVALHLGLIVWLGLSWWLLGIGRPDATPGAFVWGRMIREAGSEALPFSQIGGFVLGARAATLAGVGASFAAASTVMDVTVEMIGQLGYTLLGLGLLAWLRPESALLMPVVIGLLVMTLLAAAFVALQARGIELVETFLGRLAQAFLGTKRGDERGVRAEIVALHRRPLILAGGTFAHLAGWISNGLEAWVTLHLMGVPIGLAETLIIDSMLYGLRSAAFFVPNAIGVQEGGYVMLGGMFGLPPDMAMALSLIRRGRDLVIGVPSLFAWQLAEGRRAWRGVDTARVVVPAEPPPAV